MATATIIKRYNPEKFFNRNPTLLGSVSGIHFYEHPVYGDESPLVAKLPDGTVGLTCHWEVPAEHEI